MIDDPRKCPQGEKLSELEKFVELEKKLTNCARTGQFQLRADCPLKEHSQSRSLQISLGYKWLLVKCWSGCDRRALEAALGIDQSNFRAPLNAVPAKRRVEDPALIEKRQWSLQKLYDESTPVKPGDAVDRYIQLVRNIPAFNLTPDLRFHSNLALFEGTEIIGFYQAMLGVIRDLDGNIVSIHVTYLNPDGTVLKGPDGKKVTRIKPAVRCGATSGAAIHLQNLSDDCATIGEGIETALALGAVSGTPALSCNSASGLAAVRLPRSIKQVVVAVDNDDAGRLATLAARQRFEAEGRKVYLFDAVRTTEQAKIKGWDWADLFRLGVK